MEAVMNVIRKLAPFALLGVICSNALAAVPYVNFENHPIHALDLSPNRQLLAVAHTADQRVQLLDVSTGQPLRFGHVLTGVDPVSVRFRDDQELWVVNHISDSVTIIDVPSRTVKRTLRTADEPFDVVFANGRAFVSCSQVNTVQVFELSDLNLAPRNIAIAAEDPRALAVSSDGKSVYAAIFESGNASTVLLGGISRVEAGLPNAVNDARGPYGGVNPPPNSGSSFNPPLNASAVPPKVSLIVKRDANRRWKDDNGGDWTRLVSGDLAAVSGRVAGWDVVDRDIAVIDTQSLSVRYETGLMNIVMALAIKPNGGSGAAEITAVGTDATNEVRYEPNLNGRFVRVALARIAASGKNISDLNGHLNYQNHTVTQTERDQSLGDPRALVWNGNGSRAYVAGMGSNNVLVLNAQGQRVGAPIRVGEGPAGLSLDESRQRLYVWNHFAASLSVIDTSSNQELSRLALFNPLPEAIKAGRSFFYNTQLTSGLGQASCASCHIDARMDKLAWDLGDPSLAPAAFDQNCATSRVAPCQSFHAMKGPMTTQTMQDIIGHEPLHWRGDRKDIEAFNPAFVGLLGDDRQLTVSEMQRMKDYLRTLSFPPNPYRALDNSLPEALALPGQKTSGRFAMRGLPLPAGDAKRGLQLYTTSFLDSAFQCSSCHTLPTGMAVNGPVLTSAFNVSVGGGILPTGPNGENHLGVVSTDGFTNVSIKVPQTRNMHEKVGADFTSSESLSGFGFAHDGSVASLAEFFSASLFSPRSDQDVADLVALNMAFSGSEFPMSNPTLSNTAPLSKDSHAGVGLQVPVNGPLPSNAQLQMDLARAGKVDLIVQNSNRRWLFDANNNAFLPGDEGAAISLTQLLADAPQDRQIWTTLVKDLGRRMVFDRDGDGISDTKELAQGSSPVDANSKSIRALAGMWFNPARSGHGFDLQYAGDVIFVSWFVYEPDGAPVWYQAVGNINQTADAQNWSGALNRFVWDPALGRARGTEVGDLSMRFTSKDVGVVNWRVGNARGSERIQPLLTGGDVLANRTGNWFDPLQPGWGLGIYTQAQTNFTIMYFYDGNHQPRWVVGQAPAGDSVTHTMQWVRGACPECAYVAPSLSPAGELKLQFNGTRSLSVQTDVVSGSTPNVRWQRGPLTATPLSSVVVNEAWQ